MKRLFYLSLWIFLLTVFGCGPKVSRDFDPGMDFSRLKTYNWQSKTDKKPEDALVDERIRSAVENSLAEKGFQRVSGKGDFSVDYQYRISRASKSSDLHTGVGIGGGSGGVFGGIGVGIFDLGGNHDQGTLTINMFDSFSGRLIWKGSNTRRVPESSDPAKSAMETNRQVESILEKFPPLR